MFDDLIQASSTKWDVPIPWIGAVIQTESGFDPNATGSSGEIGLMQILPATAEAYGIDIAALPQLYDPALNIDLGTHLLHDLRVSYGEDFRSVYSAYNSGNPDAWKTNNQVAANVQRAMDNLAEWEGNIPGLTTAGFGLIGVLILAAYFFWRR